VTEIHPKKRDIGDPGEFRTPQDGAVSPEHDDEFAPVRSMLICCDDPGSHIVECIVILFRDDDLDAMFLQSTCGLLGEQRRSAALGVHHEQDLTPRGRRRGIDR